MTDCNVLFVQGNDVAQGTFFYGGDVCFVITTFLFGIVINGTVARIFFLVRRMHRLFKRVKYLVETLNLHVSGEVQEKEQQGRKYPQWLIFIAYRFAQKHGFESSAQSTATLSYLQHYCI